MELQFNKAEMSCLRWVTRETQNQEQTQEIRLPDGMPDIGKVLASWGQLLVRGKEWRSGGMSVSGGVMAWVLYVPEDGGQPQHIEAWIPFQMKWDFPGTERDGAICIQPLLRGVDARSTSARKLMVRAGISILGEAMVDDQVQIYTSDDVSEDIHLLKKTYPLLLPKEAGEKAFLIDESLTLPASVPQVEKLISYTVQPVLVEQKVMGDKLVFRGTANLHLIYSDSDGQLHSWNFEMPFSQYAELEREYDPEAEARVSLAVTALEMDRADDGSYAWKTGVTGQYLIYDHTMVDVVEDAYSPNRAVTPLITSATIPAVLDMQAESLQVEQDLEFDGLRIVDAAFSPEHPHLYREGECVTAELCGAFHLLGYDSAGELVSSTKRWETNKTFDADPTVKLYADVQPNGKAEAAVTTQGAALTAQLPMRVTAMSSQGIPMVTSLEVGEVAEPDPNRPSLILRRAGEEGLWELAKQSHSTVEAIRKANNLQQEPEPNQMVLIPVQ